MCCTTVFSSAQAGNHYLFIFWVCEVVGCGTKCDPKFTPRKIASLKQTASLPVNLNGWKMILFLGAKVKRPIFRAFAVSFREDKESFKLFS